MSTFTSGSLAVSVTLSSLVPTDAGITIIEMGPSYKGSVNGPLTSDTLSFGTSGTISFTPGTVSGTLAVSGVYNGADTGITAVPAGTADDYFAATSGGTETISFGAEEVYFGALWGSVDDANSLTFMNHGTVVGVLTGSELGVAVNSDAYVNVNVTGGYDEVILSSASNVSFETMDIAYAATAVSNTTLTTGASIVTPVDTQNAAVLLCMLAGTNIATPGGEVPVEALAAGDLVTQAGGGTARVVWVGRQTVSRRFADPLRTLPIRVSAGALADGVPVRDLLLSPDHALEIDGVLLQAGALVNGSSILAETDMPERFTYYHVETERHELILAEGAAAETFIDNVSRMAFDNWEDHQERSWIAEMELPRAKSARQVPGAIRAKLQARAAWLAQRVQAA